MIECKPKRLHNSPSILNKKNAAEIFCKQNGMTYILLDPEKLNNTDIKNLHDEKKLIFLERYERKFNEQYT